MTPTPSGVQIRCHFSSFVSVALFFPRNYVFPVFPFPLLFNRAPDVNLETIRQMELLRIVKARQDGSSGAATILIKAASPWAAYEKMYRQLLGDDDIVLVAEKRGISGDVVDIRHFPELSAQQTKMLQSIQHPNIVTVHEIYSNKANHHVVYEHMPRSLQEAVGNPYLNRQRLAAIIGQVVQSFP
ncbi:hypothetical protein CSAL01_09901 [Colletotrichum salicis]|uniref:Protein kinase domain-containing protein n=1 Tax=Colletotrichum salicis TaxID=1209931 RepID=A0A135T3G6_9PEZI|nr:hypothetical protein CSAL01_09901 [Colletotrichum salicis]